MIPRLLLLLVLSWPAVAAAVEARIADVSRIEIVLEFDVAPVVTVGDTVELSYRAGSMEMLLGRYRLREQQGNRMILTTLSTVNPPTKGMRVVVSKAAPLVSSGQTALPPQPEPSPAAPPQAAGEGRVVGVSGGNVELAFSSGTRVQVGDRYSLAFEAPRIGRVPIQGVWRVTRVEGERAFADAEGSAGQPRAGQVAIPLRAEATAAPSATGKPAEQTGGSLFPNPPPGSFDEYLKGTSQPPPPDTPLKPGWIGLQMQGLTPDLARSLNLPADQSGILVADVVAGGPAEHAGLRSGDVLLDVDGRVLTPPQLAEQVRQARPDTVIRLRVWRDGRRMFIAVRTAARP